MQETIPCQKKRIAVHLHPSLLHASLQGRGEAVEYVYLKSSMELSAVEPAQLELQYEFADEPFFLRQAEAATHREATL